MCGIVGILELRPTNGNSDRCVQQMTKVIAHRGPDDDGFFSQPPIYFGFRRLAILDLSSAGHQPMTSDDGRYTIVFNGEIYNYIELANELKKLHHVFHSHTDTEVILHAYQQWGAGAVKRFNGMWAMAIWDSAEHTLFCSRDRFGIKPFYYTIADEQFIFGSEIKALITHPAVRRQPNFYRLYDYLTYGYQDHTADTFFDSIQQIPPAHSLTMNSKGEKKIQPYWSLNTQRPVFTENPTSFTQGFLDLFRDSINLRLRSDVPIGSCLSGGLDSSSIVCIVNEILRDSGISSIGDQQKTFSAVYDEKEVDEREYSQAVIDKTGATQFLIAPKGDDVLRDLDTVLYHQDEPFGSTSIFAQWYVMKRASEAGMKVMLDGQGADELLAGYFGYFGSSIASLIRQWHIVKALQEVSAWQRNHKSLGTRYLYHIMVSVILKLMPRGIGKALIAGAGADGSLFMQPSFIHTYGSPPPQITASYRDPLRNELHRVLRVGLPALLHYEDRDSMAWSIEARVPFLDYRLVEYVFALPNEQKINQGMTKVVLREAMKGILPEKVRTRQSKLGFATPEKSWLSGALQPIIRETLRSDSFAGREIFKTDTVRRLADQAMTRTYHRYADSPVIWRWVNTELWWRKFID